MDRWTDGQRDRGNCSGQISEEDKEAVQLSLYVRTKPGQWFDGLKLVTETSSKEEREL